MLLSLRKSRHSVKASKTSARALGHLATPASGADARERDFQRGNRRALLPRFLHFQPSLAFEDRRPCRYRLVDVFPAREAAAECRGPEPEKRPIFEIKTLFNSSLWHSDSNCTEGGRILLRLLSRVVETRLRERPLHRCHLLLCCPRIPELGARGIPDSANPSNTLSPTDSAARSDFAVTSGVGNPS